MDSPHPIHRRGFCGGVLASLAVPSAAAQTRFRAPLIDELEIQVLIDNATFGPFLPELNLPGLRVIRAVRGGPRMPRETLQAEFGLSLLATSRRGRDTRRVLMDFGYTPAALANNLRLLGLDATSIDAAVLSHGHIDHYGGFSATARNGRPPLPLLVGGEEVFCQRIATIGDPPPIMGALDRDELARAGFAPEYADQPRIVAGHGFTSGVIPLQTGERPAIPTRMQPGVGCEAAALSPLKREGADILDDAEHELALSYNVRGLGLVVLSACSHRGVLNAIGRAQDLTGVRRVHAVFGGLHLVRPRTEDEARHTAAELARLDIGYVIPMHCTGEVFIEEAMRLMPNRIVRSYVGSRFIMSA